MVSVSLSCEEIEFQKTVKYGILIEENATISLKRSIKHSFAV